MTGVELLHYRPWRGAFRDPIASVWPITRVALWMMFRRKVFWALYGLGLLFFLMFFFGQYLFAWAQSQMSESSVSIFGFTRTPDQIRKWLQDTVKLNGTATTYANFFWLQGQMIMVILALAGSVLVGNDFNHGSLAFYLSKPLSRWHYLLGKCLAVGVFVNLMTTLPAIVLFVQYGLLATEDYFSKNIHLLLGILGYGLVLTVCLSLLLVATASWVRRTVPLIMLWTVLFVFLHRLSSVLVDGLHYNPHWRLIDIWNDTYVVGCGCMGMGLNDIRPSPQPEFFWAVLVLGAICLSCLSYWILRIRAVEVVR